MPSAKRRMKRLLFRLPFIGKRIRDYYAVVGIAGFEPGHFYSTIPDLNEVKKKADAIFGNETIADVDLNLDNQFRLAVELKQYAASIPYAFKGPIASDTRYRYSRKNAFYNYSDVIFLFCILLHFKPSRIIEIGCGSSSAIMLDTNEHFLNGKIQFTFIDPYPQGLIEKLNPTDRKTISILENKIQDVPLSLFQALAPGDILFVDSSHVSKSGSDVNHILFNILPVLKPGVLIHFHDIFFPFELPREWVLKYHFYWNENYLLRAFLMNNSAYEILLFNTLLQKKNRQWFEAELPDCLIDELNTGSIWLRKKG
jgi:hypothetical protein